MDKTIPTLEQLFTEIYNNTYSDILRFVISRCGNICDVNDLIQNIYLSFFRRLKKRGGEAIDEPKRYLITIAKNELKKHYWQIQEQRKTIPVFSPETTGEYINLEGMLDFLEEDVIEGAIEASEIWDCISSYDTLTVKIFTLFFVNDLKITQIAEELDVSESMVKNRLYRTLAKVREKFK